MPKVLLIAGKKRAGKDAFANAIMAEAKLRYKSVQIIAFADPLKDIMSITLGISLQELDNLKNDPSNPHRAYLQRFGTEAMKKYFGDMVWVHMLNMKIERSLADIIIVPDFRFAPEAIAGATTINVVRESLGNALDSHSSENGLIDFDFDKVIYNNGSLEDLAIHAKKLLGAI